MGQGYLILRLKWPNTVIWGNYKGRRTYSDLNKSKVQWRRLIKIHRIFKRLFPSSNLGPEYEPDGYFCKYYLEVSETQKWPVVFFEWPCRWMKERERRGMISSYLGRYVDAFSSKTVIWRP